MSRGLFHDRPDDPGVLGQQIVPAHPRLPRQAGRHDDDVAARGVGVVVRPDDPCVVADDRGRLGEVESLALREALDDVDENDVGQAGFGDPLRGRGADVAGADDGDLVASHAEWSSFRADRVPHSLGGGGRHPGRPDQSARGPAARTASLTPPANASKLSANIRASFAAARS